MNEKKKNPGSQLGSFKTTLFKLMKKQQGLDIRYIADYRNKRTMYDVYDIYTRLFFILMDKYESVCVRLKRSRGNRKQSTVVANSIQCSKKFGNLYSGTDQKVCDCES